MKEKIFKNILLAFSLLFFMFPTYYLLNNAKMLVFSIFIIIFIFVILGKKINILLNKIEKKYFLIVLICAILTRIVSVIILSKIVIPWSDFGIAYDNATTLEFNTPYYHIANHWLLLPKILSYVFKLFGKSYFTAYMFMGVVQIISICILYFTATEFFQNKKFGFIVCMLYTFIPSNLIYVSQLTPEHLSVPFLLLTVYFVTKFLNKRVNKIDKNDHFLLLGAGTFLAIASAFKDFSQVFFIAFIIIIILYCLKYKWSIKLIIVLSMIFLSFSYVSNIIYEYKDDLVDSGYKVVRNAGPNYIYNSLSSKAYGGHNKALYAEYEQRLINYNYNYKKLNKEIMSSLKSDLIKDYLKLPRKLNWKAGIIFNQTQINTASKIDCFIKSLKLGNHLREIENTKRYLLPFNGYYMFGIIILFLVGLIRIYIKRDLRNYYLYISYFGASVLVSLIEPQARYLYIFDVIICFMAVNGIKHLYNNLSEAKLEDFKVLSKMKHKKNNINVKECDHKNETDMVNGILILLMVFANVLPDYFYNVEATMQLNDIIYMFCIPAFIIISGISFDFKSNVLKYILVNVKKYMIPYTFYLIIIGIIANKFFAAISLNEFLQGGRFLSGLFATFWFVNIILLTKILFCLVNKYFNKHIYKIVIMFFIYFVNLLIVKKYTFGINILWNVDVLGISLLYYTIGFHIKKYCEQLINRKSLVISFVISVVMIALLNLKVISISFDLKNALITQNPILQIIFPIVITICIINICKYLNGKLIVSKILKFYGTHALIIMFLSPLIYYTLLKFGIKIGFFLFIISATMPALISKFILRKNKVLEYLG